MKDILKFMVKCLLAPLLLVLGSGIAAKALEWASKDSTHE